MIGAVLLMAAAASALLAGLALGLRSLVSTALAAYLALVANLGLATLLLSPFRQVDRGGLALVEAIALAGTLAWWLRAGRPAPPLRGARAAAREVVSSPVMLAFLVVVAALLGYELVVGLSMPPNNWDGLTYHLARVAAWLHHGGYSWIANAPTDRLNEFQPLAEQQLLFLFAATGSDRLYALPQLTAELAILLAVYGAARRLGFAVGPAAASALLFATFTIVVLEGTTPQNDLVAASFPVVAACLLLGEGTLEAALAGASAGIGLGAKLTTVVVWPVLVWLALVRGRRVFLVALGGALAGIVAIGCWGYLLNLVHTGHLLGHGGGRTEHTVSPSWHGSLVTGLSILYMAMDLSAFWPHLIEALTAVGALSAAVVGLYLWRRDGPRRAIVGAATVAVPFFAPLLVIAGAAVLSRATGALGAPVKGPGGSVSTGTGLFGGLNNTSDENQSYFGPIGAVALVGVPVLTGLAYVTGRIDVRRLALACALPVFLVVLALGSQFNLWLGRFLIIPAALAAPLLATLFRGRAVTAGYLLVGALVAALAVTRDLTKSVGSPQGAPWSLTRVEAVAESQAPAARGFAALQRAVPQGGCLGAVLAEDDPSYLLGGSGFSRRVVYLPLADPVAAARRAGLDRVVVSKQEEGLAAVARAAHAFAAAGWRVTSLGGFWWLAERPDAGGTGC